MRFFAVTVAVFLVLASPAGAGSDALVTAGDAAQKRGDHDQAIRLYGGAIESGAVSRETLAEIRVKRSESYRAKGLFDRAVRDSDAAIGLRPDFAEAFNSRGLAYAKKGLYGRAISDYDAATRLKPDFAGAYNNRGRVYFYQGRFREAAADFAARLEIRPRHVFPMLWLYLARRRMGQDGAAELAANTAGMKGNHWISSVVSLYLGKVGPERVLAAARDDDPKEQREKEAEASFYIGQDRLLKGDRTGAAKYFKATLASGLVGFYEYTGAKAELQRMGLTELPFGSHDPRPVSEPHA